MEKIFKVVYRGLTTDITEEEHSEELKNQGYEVTFIRQCVKEDRRLPMHKISLMYSLATKSIFNMISLFKVSVKVEPYRLNNSDQCYKAFWPLQPMILRVPTTLSKMCMRARRKVAKNLKKNSPNTQITSAFI